MKNKDLRIIIQVVQVLVFSGLGLWLLFGFFAGAAQAISPTIYIDAITGDDLTGDGSSGKPYQTIQKAHDVSIDGVGEVFYIRAGAVYSSFVVIKGGAAPDKPDIYTVWPGTGSYPKIFENTTNLIKINAGYVTIDGLDVDGSAGSATRDLILSDEGVAAPYITIRNCKVHHSSGDEGIQLKNAPYARIENVESYNNGGDGLNVCCGSDNSTLRFNHSHDNTGYNAHGGIYVYDTQAITIEFNVLVHNSEAGIQIEDVSNSVIRNNLATNHITNTDKMVYGDGIFVDKDSDNNLIINNTVYSNTADGIRIDEAIATGNIMRDNIAVANKEYGLRAAIAQTHDHNLAWNSGLGNWGGVLTIGATDVSTDPLFVTGPTGLEPDFYLDPSSSAVDTGSQTAVAAGLSFYTTSAGQQADQGTVDMGYHYAALPYTLTLTPDPTSIVANGISTTTLTAVLLTNSGDPVPDGTTVVFNSSLGFFSNQMLIHSTETTGGQAQAVLSSVPAGSTVTSTVKADVYGTAGETQVAFTLPTCEADLTQWVEHTTNPIYDPTESTYYPSVIYDANAFGDNIGDVISITLPYTYTVTPYYKMWVSRSNANSGIRFVYSDDGISWHEFNGGMQLPGVTTDGYHSLVLYDAGGFGATGVYYKIWYWDPPLDYDISDIRYAESSNGIQWINDQAITQTVGMPLVTGSGGDWNRGSYGPIHVFYQSGVSNTGSEPFNYSYVMYYDGTTGGAEVTGLAYSADGKMWTRYGNNPVLDKGSAGDWDSNYSAYGSIIKDEDGAFHFWYSGGISAVNEGIGYATSGDGISWTKSLSNPIFHVSDGVGWRTVRTYTPIVLYSSTRFDGHGGPEQYKMWFTGDNGNRAIGYATLNPLHLASTSGSGQDGSIDTALDQPFVVELHDSCDNPVSQIAVTFAISNTPVGATGQSLSVTNGTTDDSGKISTTLTLGSETGPYVVQGSAVGVINMPTVFTATAIEGGGIYLPIILKNAS